MEESAEDPQSILENGAIGIQLVAADGTVLWANRAEVDILGYDRDDYVGHDFAAFHGDSDAIFKIRESLKNGEPINNLEARLVAKDGSIRDVLIASNVFRLKGEFVHARVFTRDITDYKHAAMRLSEATDRLRRAQAAAGLGTWDWDLEKGQLVWDGVEAVHGLDPGSFGQSFDAYLADIHPAEREKVAAAIDAARESGRDLDIEYRIVWPDGSVHWVAGRGQCFRDKNGRTVRMAGTCQDITTRKRLEQRKDDLLAFASHELRSPLTSLLGFARMLEKKAAANPDAFDEISREAISVMDSEAARMRDIIESFLDLARAESGQVKVELEDLDLAELVRDEVGLLRQRHPEMQITEDVPDGPLNVRSDERRLRQSVDNLLDNAAKYGGTPPEVTVKLTIGQRGAELRVKDNGNGIRLEDREHIFERFYRGTALAGRGKGLGIGLFLTRQFLDQIGGSITFRSAEGEGTEFIVRLPLLVAEPASSEAAVP